MVSKGHIDSGIQYLYDITETIINKLSEKPQNILKTRVFITLSWIYKKVGNLEKSLKTIEFALKFSKKYDIHRFSLYLSDFC